MIKIENVTTAGWEPAIRGMRNPMNSWDKSDSIYCDYMESCDICKLFNSGDGCLGGKGIETKNGVMKIGQCDHDLMMRLRNAGTDHRKFMRMIGIYMDITAPTFWWAEFDTYKVGTVRDSCSKMHHIHVEEIIPDSFSHEGIDEVGGYAVQVFEDTVSGCEWLRKMFNETHEKKYWRALIELLPEGFHLRATVYFSYENAANMHRGRHNHKLTEWHVFDHALQGLPYSELITGEEKE